MVPIELTLLTERAARPDFGARLAKTCALRRYAPRIVSLLCMWTEEVLPDSKALLREALSSLDIRGSQAPATDEVCLTLSSQ